MKKYDIAIIGGGFSGLMSAAILSKHGYSVCLLEKEKKVGGNLQTFRRFGKTFNTGLHYVGALDNGQILNKIFKYVGVYDKISLKPLDNDCFDKIIIDKKEYCSVTGFDNYENNLKRLFPNDVEDISQYMNKIKEVWNSNPYLNLRDIDESIVVTEAFDNDGLMDVVNSVIKNEELKSLLLANNALYAGDPERTPFYIHALITSLFIQSAYTISDGSHNLVNAFVEVLKEQSVDILTNKKVSKILTENGLAKKIITEDGSEIVAETVFSSVHPTVSVSWFDEGVFRKIFLNRISSLKNTTSSFVLYLSFKPKSFKHYNNNHFIYNTSDVFGAVYEKNEWPKSIIFYTTEDKESIGYAESATAIAFMNFEEVEKWKDKSFRKGNEEYDSFKNEKSDKIIKLLSKSFQDIETSVENYATSTPLTYLDYTGIPEGSMYGIAKDYTNQVGTYMPIDTRVSNFKLMGQSIGLHGIMGVAMNSVLACSKIVGINKLISEIREF